MRRRVLTLAASLFVANVVCVEAGGQQARQYPAFTLVTRSTEYDAKGEILHVTTTTRYESSTGDWRSVGKVGDDEYATLYRRGRGVYKSNSRTMRLIKQTGHAPGCPLRTAEELRADPKFSRTEQVLGFTAYLLIDRPAKDLHIEHYYIPELGGGTPVKQVTTYTTGQKFIGEPISVTFGEPDEINITGPDYQTIEQEPIFTRNLDAHLLWKPDADYPAEALARGLSGFVNVMIIVDESGRVISAGALTGAPSALRLAAVEAAYKASFRPVIVDDRPVVVTGIITYQFVLPK